MHAYFIGCISDGDIMFLMFSLVLYGVEYSVITASRYAVLTAPNRLFWRHSPGSRLLYLVPAWPWADVSTSQPRIVKTDLAISRNRKQNLKLISATRDSVRTFSKSPICQNCPGDGKMRTDIAIMGSPDDDQDRGGRCKTIALSVTSSYRKSLLFETINS